MDDVILLQSIMETTQEGIWVIGMDGTTRFANALMAAMLCIQLVDIAHASIFAYLDEAAANRLQMILQSVHATFHFQDELSFRRQDGRQIHCRLNAVAVCSTSGEVSGLLLLVSDYSERQVAEARLRAYQRQLQELASELTSTEERERRKIAVDLHDHISQAFSVSLMKLGMLQTGSAQLKPHVRKEMEEVRNILTRAAEQCHTLIFELSPPVLYEFGLYPAVEWLAEHLRQEYSLIVDVSGEQSRLPLAEEKCIFLYRTVCECLQNVVKHAGTTHAWVKIHNTGQYLTLVVRDNGQGFTTTPTPPAATGRGGFGLFSIRERLRYFGGTMAVESEPEHGTQVTVIIPMGPE